MANIDQLNIQITASSNEATTAINKLVHSLQDLNKQLGLADGTKFSKVLDSMAQSINKFSDSISGFKTDGFEKASESAKSASESFRESTEQAERFKDALSKISEAEKSFAQRKLFESDLGKSSNPNDYVPSGKQEPVLALPMFEKMLPAITQANDALNGLEISFEDVITTADGVDVVTQKFIDWKSQVQEIENSLDGAKSKFTFAEPHWDAKGDYHSADVTAWVSNINPQVVEGYFYEIEDSANKCLPAIQNVGTTALATAEQLKTVGDYSQQAFEKTTESWSGFTFPWKETEGDKPFESVAESANKASDSIKDVIEQVQKYRTLISGFESGKIPFVESGYQDALKGYAEASKSLKDYKDKFEIKAPKGADYTSVLTTLDALSRALGEVSEKFGMVGDKGIQMFKTLTTPLRAAASEYVEKFKTMSDRVVSFQKNFRAQMKKVSDFWKRTMRTFTFMVVRKAFTAIIKEVGNAIQSLAMYSNAMGTAFNTDISLMVADFQYLGRSIVSVFAPLLNYIAPIIDAIVDRIATLLSYIGMLFAALGGSTSFTKAKKNVGNYAESLDSASKSAKNLTMGIDELNILSESQGSSSAKPYDGWEDAWEEADIPQWVTDIADWLKDWWHKFFDPLKEAWDRAKQYVVDGLKTMLNSLKKMFGDIANDFFEVWGQEKTIRMFEQLFRIIGDIERVVRNLANGFNEAWNYNKTGLHIIENIRDIMAILVDHARNISYYMIGWAEKINFKPLLQSFETLTNSAKSLADFLGGVIEDIFVYGILKYIQFLIEDAIPHLQHTIAEIIDTFNFATLREKLRPLIEAVEEAMENIHTGVTTAIGNLGKSLARFVNSGEFYTFLESLANVAKQITAARVEKVLTGLGEGIINIAKAVVKFVNSKIFQGFIEFIGDWIDKHSKDDIAKILTNIANSILFFKFAQFTTSKLSGFFKFFTVITALKNLGTIASQFKNLAGETENLGKASQLLTNLPSTFTSLGTAIGNAFNGIGSVVGSVGKQIKYFFTQVSTDEQAISLLQRDFTALGTSIKDAFSKGITAINEFSAGLSPMIKLIGGVGTAFLEWKAVGDSAKDLAYAINGDEEKSIGGSIAGLVGKIGLASAAFTAFLGFPAGLVAGLVVGAVSAIKHFQDAVDQINFDHMLNSVMTTGDMTIGEIRGWYDQVTSKISESASEWKDIERNLTQDRKDIDEYAKSIEGISAAWRAGADEMGSSVGTVVGLYQDLQGAINNYIDESTNALVKSILAQRAKLEADGIDVNQLIHNIYQKANAEKDLVDDAIKKIDTLESEYADIVEKYGEDSDEAKAKLREINQAMIEAEKATSKWIDTTADIDMSDAAEEISKLGKSLDLSQYGTDWTTAASDLETGIREIQSKYTTAMGDLNSELEDKMNVYDQALKDGFITNAEYQTLSYEAQAEFRKATDELSTATTGALDVYSKTLSDKLVAVASQASSDWDNNVNNVWSTNLGKDKNAYILSQIKDYAELLTGSEGLSGALSEAYASVPGAVDPDVIAAIQSIVDSEESNYNSLTEQRVDTMKGQTLDVYQNVLDFANGIDYETPMGTYAERTFNAAYAHMQGQDFDSLGKLWSDSTGNALVSNSTIFDDANRLVAGEGSAAFSDTYVGFLDSNMAIIQSMQNAGITSVGAFNESAVGEVANSTSFTDAMGDYGTNAAGSFNTKFEEETKKTQPIITEWFKSMDGWIHDNPFLPFGSPNKKTKEYGEDMVTGLNLGITTNASTTITAVNTWFTYINAAIRNKLVEVKTMFTTMLTEIFSGSGWDYNTPITTLFTNVTMAITSNLTLLGENLLGTQLPMFMETYIMPFFSVEMWQPLFDVLLNEVFALNFTTFSEWFTTVMTEWWNVSLLSWFKTEKWNKEIFEPLKKNIQLHWNNFKKWWDTSIKDWWDKHLINPWFTNKKWDEDIFTPLKKNIDTHWKNFVNTWDTSMKDWWDNHVLPWMTKFLAYLTAVGQMTEKIVEDTFAKVEKSISDHMDKAKENVVNAANEMKNALQHVADVLGEIIEKLSTLSGMGVDIHLLGFADGGFPSEGSLFFAGEQGAELIGNIGGRTAVASNDEITGIREAVYESGNQESALLAQLIAIGTQLLDKEPVVIGDRDIAEMANNGQSQLGMRIIT